MYHEVTDSPEQTGFKRKSALSYKHQTKEFEMHLDLISKSSANVCLADTIDFALPLKHILLTFDDGGKFAMYSADRIEKRGWRGHYFIATSKLDTGNYLSKKEVAELNLRGHIIGSHSHTHPDIFFSLSRAEMLEEWNISNKILSQMRQKPINMASIPGGDMNLLSQITALDSGIKYLFTSEPTFNPWTLQELTCIGRVCPKKGAPRKAVEDIVNFQGFHYQMFKRRVKQAAKRVLFPYYQWKLNRDKSEE